MQEVSSLKQNKGAGGKAGQIISKLKDKPFLMSLLFNVAALLVCLIFFRPTYEVSDDYMTDAVLSGAFGRPVAYKDVSCRLIGRCEKIAGNSARN